MVKKTSTKKSPVKKGTRKTATKKSQNKKIQEIISEHPGPVIVSPEVAKSSDVVFIPPTQTSFAKVLPVAPSAPVAPMAPMYIPPPQIRSGIVNSSVAAPESALQKALRERLEKTTAGAKFQVGFGKTHSCPQYEVWDPVKQQCQLLLKQNVYENTPLRR